ncbi:hypothetical protein OIU78_022704 [Salix suchowensis]|nr:hypothetical protein OIU78_022704 [Salix suchowensis]
MTASRHQASSPPCAMENDVSSFNDGVGVVVSAKGKEKEDAVFLQLQSAAADDVCLLDSFRPSSSFAKGMDVGVCSSSFARENAVTLLGNLAVETDLVTVGDAPLPLPMAAMHDSHDFISSLPIAKVLGENATTPSPPIAVANETSMLGKVAGSKAAKTDFARMGAMKTAFAKVGAVKTDFVKTAAAHGGVLANAAATNGSKDGHASNGKWKDLFSSNRRADSGTKLVVSAAEKVLVKRWVPVKKSDSLIRVKPIEQQSSDEPSRPLTHEEASRPTGCEERSQPNDVRVSSSLNESLDEQWVDPMQMETDARRVDGC